MPFLLWLVLAASASPSAPADATEYLEVVDRYRSGDLASASHTLASWEVARLVGTVRGIRQQLERRQDVPGWDDTTIAAAVLLHLELLQERTGDPIAAGLQVRLVGEHLGSIRACRPPSPLAPALHQAVVLYLQATLRLEDLGRLFEAMGSSFRSDRRLLLAEGTFHETLASRRLEAARRASLVPVVERSLESAERCLRNAAAAEPHSDEASLRLAHVLVLRGKPAEALDRLDAVLGGATSPETRYLAYLFQGQAHAALGHLAEAARSYQAGHQERPCAQSASVALAHLAILEGRQADARAVLELPLSGPGRCEDPWALYDFGPARELRGVVEELRRRVSR